MISKKHRTLKLLSAAMCSLALAGSANFSHAQGVDDFVVDDFATGTGGWAYNYGSIPTMTIEWDGAEDRGPGAAPGSMKVTIPFDLCSGLIQADFESVFGSTLDLTTYTKLHFSVKVDPSSSRLSGWGNGGFGNMRFHVRPADWSSDVNLAASDTSIGDGVYTNWVDFAVDIDQTSGLATKAVTGILGIDIWSGWGNCDDFPTNVIGHTNTVILWIDNIWFEKVVGPPPPPPTITGLNPAGTPGVQVIMAGADQWQRDAIVTPSDMTSLFWAGNGETPVTYSFTIADFPDRVAHEGFEAHMYIVNRDTATAFDETYGGCDWNVPNIVIMSLLSDTNGGFGCQFQFKTNLPNANPPDNPIHRPGSLNSPTALGTWSVTFVNDTNVTMSGPGGISTNFTIPIEAVQNNFSPAASFIQFGFHKNDDENDGHNNGVSGTFGSVSKTGGASVFNDPLNGATLTNLYAWRRTSPTYVQYVGPGTKYDMTWTLPANGFAPQVAGAVTGPYSDLIPTATYIGGGVYHAYIDEASIPVGTAAYFRLVKREFSQLQVLFPGETNAPNTVTGKIGTPDPVSAASIPSFTVNACDSAWNIVAGVSDTIAITSSDGAATLPLNAALVNGTGTFQIQLNTVGPQTVTATDVTNGAITPGTSSSITVQ